MLINVSVSSDDDWCSKGEREHFRLHRPDKKIYDLVGDIIVFKERYDHRQLWFSFVFGVVEYDIPQPTIKETKDLKRIMNTPLIKPSQEALMLYHYEKGVNQLVLRYVERQSLSYSEWSRIYACDCPCWDRFKGHLLSVSISKQYKMPSTYKNITINAKGLSSRKNDVDNVQEKIYIKIRKILKSYCKGRFYCSSRKVYFELLSDYAIGKLLLSE